MVGLVGLGFKKNHLGRATEAVLLMEKVSDTSLEVLVMSELVYDPSQPLPCAAP